MDLIRFPKNFLEILQKIQLKRFAASFSFCQNMLEGSVYNDKGEGCKNRWSRYTHF